MQGTDYKILAYLPEIFSNADHIQLNSYLIKPVQFIQQSQTKVS